MKSALIKIDTLIWSFLSELPKKRVQYLTEDFKSSPKNEIKPRKNIKMNGLVEMIQSLETIAKMGEEMRGLAQEMLPSDDYIIISSFLS